MSRLTGRPCHSDGGQSESLQGDEMRRGLNAVGAALLATALALAACGDDEQETGGTKQSSVDLINSGEITTCTHLPYQPFQFEQAGKVVGLRRRHDRPRRQEARRQAGDRRHAVRGHPVRRGPQRAQVRHRRGGDDDHARARGEDRVLGAVLRRQPGAAGQEGQRHQVARGPHRARRSASSRARPARCTPRRTRPRAWSSRTSRTSRWS